MPASLLRVHVDGETLAEALPRLQETYCGSMAYEIEHISDHFQRVWLRKAIESWRYRSRPTQKERVALYRATLARGGVAPQRRRELLHAIGALTRDELHDVTAAIESYRRLLVMR